MMNYQYLGRHERSIRLSRWVLGVFFVLIFVLVFIVMLVVIGFVHIFIHARIWFLRTQFLFLRWTVWVRTLVLSGGRWHEGSCGSDGSNTRDIGRNRQLWIIRLTQGQHTAVVAMSCCVSRVRLTAGMSRRLAEQTRVSSHVTESVTAATAAFAFV